MSGASRLSRCGRSATPMPKTSTGATAARRGSSPVYRTPGSGMPCTITVVLVEPLSQNSALKWVTWTRVTSSRSAIGCRVPGTSPFGVLCSRYTTGTSRPSRRPPNRPPVRQLPLLGTLQQHDVDLGVGQLFRGHLDRRGRPRVRGGTTQPERTAVGRRRHEVGVSTVDERGGPGTVDVPEQDPHDPPPREPQSASTAATTSAGSTVDRHGWPGTGQTAARLSRHGAVGSPSRIAGTPYGRHRAYGTVGANRLTTGVPTAAATCAGPVLATTRHSAPASTAASSPSEVRPPRSYA